MGIRGYDIKAHVLGLWRIQHRKHSKTDFTAEPPRQGLLPEQGPLRKIVLFWYGLIIGFVNPAAAGWT